MEQRLLTLETEVAALREELSDLRGEVQRLRRTTLRRGSESTQSSVLDSPTRPGSLSSFSLVSERLEQGLRGEDRRRP